MSTKKDVYSVKEGKLGIRVMSKVGVFVLTPKTSQADLKKIYDFGLTVYVEKKEATK